MTTTDRGFVFSIDLVVSFLSMLLMVYLLLLHIGLREEREAEALNRLAFQRNAIFLTDSLVKNNNPEQALLGSASLDEKRHRVLSNQLDREMLLAATGFENEGFFVSRLSFELFGKERIVFEENQGNECIALDRVVLIEGARGKIRVVLCEK